MSRKIISSLIRYTFGFFLLIGLVVLLQIHVFRGPSIPDKSGGDMYDPGVHTEEVSEDKEESEPIARLRASEIATLLGVGEAKTYLLLFLNNTELRPGGGFIGTYAVVRVHHGRPEVIIVDGTENLDNNAPVDRFVRAPKEMERYLRIANWEFRDSNWSPDFSVSTERGLQFYREEGGTLAEDIDAVFAVTPTVLERLMEITGPIVIEGLTFTSENVTETLEYEVEYGYRDRGIAVSDRKDIIEPFMKAFIGKVSLSAILNSEDLTGLIEDMIREKHLLGYSSNPEIGALLHRLGVVGLVAETDIDYLLWVDANLSALKTDRVINRNLTYHIEPAQGGYQGVAEMRYAHEGTEDWRTTRYQSYARIYVPEGAILTQVERISEDGESTAVTPVDTGRDLGKTWFGFLVRVGIGEITRYRVTYRLPSTIDQSIAQGEYRLTVQKQLGSVETDLSLDLDFDRLLIGARPGEVEAEWGDARYHVNTSLIEDRTFQIGF